MKLDVGSITPAGIACCSLPVPYWTEGSRESAQDWHAAERTGPSRTGMEVQKPVIKKENLLCPSSLKSGGQYPDDSRGWPGWDAGHRHWQSWFPGPARTAGQ